MAKRFLSALVALLMLAAMTPVGATPLCSVGITSAVTGLIEPAVSGLGAPTSMTIEGRFAYVASSATTVDVWVQSTIDGSNWFDVADFEFSTASGWKMHNVSGSAGITNATLGTGALSANTKQDGTLTNQYRCYITTVGTYGGGTNITVNIYPRY